VETDIYRIDWKTKNYIGRRQKHDLRIMKIIIARNVSRIGLNGRR